MAKKGNIPWNKGKKGISKETRRKLSESHKGKSSWIGRRHSEISKCKMSLSQKKRFEKEDSPMKGKLPSKETIDKQRKTIMITYSKPEMKIKLSKAQKDRFRDKDELEKLRKNSKMLWEREDFRENQSRIRKGKHFSIRTEFKKGITPWIKGKTHSQKTRERLKETRALQILPMKDTKIEVKIQNFLKELGIEFIPHKYIKDIVHSYQCDLFIPSFNLIIECDGNYYHNYPYGKELDNLRTKELQEKGYNVLRLWESEINKMSLEDFEKELKEIK